MTRGTLFQKLRLFIIQFNEVAIKQPLISHQVALKRVYPHKVALVRSLQCKHYKVAVLNLNGAIPTFFSI